MHNIIVHKLSAMGVTVMWRNCCLRKCNSMFSEVNRRNRLSCSEIRTVNSSLLSSFQNNDHPYELHWLCHWIDWNSSEYYLDIRNCFIERYAFEGWCHLFRIIELNTQAYSVILLNSAVTDLIAVIVELMAMTRFFVSHLARFNQISLSEWLRTIPRWCTFTKDSALDLAHLHVRYQCWLNCMWCSIQFFSSQLRSGTGSMHFKNEGIQ